MVILKIFIKYISKNKITAVLILLYAIAMLSVIAWGIPNKNHPFNYHMDEWHQMQSIRTLFTQGSPNVSGAAHGPIFQFLLSGIYLGFFTLIGTIDPFAIKSSVTEFNIQEKLFILLRLNTLMFGILSLFLLGIISKKFFKVHPALTISLFVITPLWLSLSNYFKYDIALTFWILVSFFFLLRFGTFPTLKNYLLAGLFCSLAVSTKISALPLLIIYIFSFFYFMYKKHKDYSYLFIGVFLFLLTFLVFGVPDLLLQKGDYGEYFYSNIISTPKETENMILDYRQWWAYILLKIMPLDFGYPFFVIYAAALFYWIKRLLFEKFKKNYMLYKNEIFLLICFFIFTVSLIPLKIGANGNRLLVLLPFLSLLSSSFLTILWKQCSEYSKKMLVIFFVVIITLQTYQSLVQVSMKWDKDVREIASIWIDKNISEGEKIGIENIPIYQMLPDIIVKEFYSKQYFPKTNTKFNYAIINESSTVLPNVVIVTDRKLHINYLRNSPKKLLINKLQRENYKIVAEFKPSRVLYKIFGNELNMRTSGMVPIATITVYKKM